MKKNKVIISMGSLLGIGLSVGGVVSCENSYENKTKIELNNYLNQANISNLKDANFKSNNLASQFTIKDLDIPKLPKGNIRIKSYTANDIKGEVVLEVFATYKEANKSSVKTEIKRIIIAGFKTIKNKLDEEVNQIKVSLLSEENKDEILPSDYTKKIDNINYQNLNNNSNFELIKNVKADDIKGQIKIYYHLKDKINNLQSVNKQIVFDGFLTKEKQERLKEQDFINEKIVLLEPILKNNLNWNHFLPSEINNDKFETNFEDFKLIIENIKNIDDEKGSLSIIFHIQSLKIKDIISENKTFSITNLKTKEQWRNEQKSLIENKLNNKLKNNFEDYFSIKFLENKSSVLPSELQKEINYKIINLKPLLENLNSNLLINETYDNDDELGVSKITLHIQYYDEKIDRNIVLNPISFNINNLQTKQQREYLNEENFLNNELNNLNITLKQGKWSNYLPSQINVDNIQNYYLNYDLEVINISNINDSEGSFTLTVQLASKKINGLKSKSKNIIINDFKSTKKESQKILELNNLINKNNFYNLTFDSTKLDKLPSEINKNEDLIITLTDSKYRITDLQTISNDQEGKLLVKFKVFYFDEEFNENITSNFVEKELTGFENLEKRNQKITKAYLNNEIQNFNFVLKDNLRSNEYLPSDIKNNQIKTDYDKYNVVLINVNNNDVLGNKTIEFKLQSKDYLDIFSETKIIQFSNFNTKSNYLESLKTILNQQIIKYNFYNYQIVDKNDTLPSNLELNKNLYIGISNLDYQVFDVIITPNDNSGEANVKFKIKYTEPKFNETIVSNGISFIVDNLLTSQQLKIREDLQRLTLNNDLIIYNDTNDTSSIYADEISKEAFNLNYSKYNNDLIDIILESKLVDINENSGKVLVTYVLYNSNYSNYKISRVVEFQFKSIDWKEIEKYKQWSNLFEENLDNIPFDKYNENLIQTYIQNDKNLFNIFTQKVNLKNTDIVLSNKIVKKELGFFSNGYYIIFEYQLINKNNKEIKSSLIQVKSKDISKIIKRNEFVYDVENLYLYPQTNEDKLKKYLPSQINDSNIKEIFLSKIHTNIFNSPYSVKYKPLEIIPNDEKGELTVKFSLSYDGTNREITKTYSNFLTREEFNDLENKKDKELKRLNETLNKINYLFLDEPKTVFEDFELRKGIFNSPLEIGDFQLKNHNLETENIEIIAIEKDIDSHLVNIKFRLVSKWNSDIKSEERIITLNNFLKEKDINEYKEEINKIYLELRPKFKIEMQKINQQMLNKIRPNDKSDKANKIRNETQKQFLKFADTFNKEYKDLIVKYMLEIYLNDVEDNKKISKDIYTTIQSSYVDVMAKISAMFITTANDSSTYYSITSWGKLVLNAKHLQPFSDAIYKKNALSKKQQFTNLALLLWEQQLKNNKELNQIVVNKNLSVKVENIIKDVVDYYLNYYANLKWRNIVDRTLPETDVNYQHEYSSKRGRTGLLSSGWEELFSYKNRFINNNYSDSQHRNTVYQIEQLQLSNNLSKEEADLILGYINYSLKPMMSTIENISLKIKFKLTSLLDSAKAIAQAKK
ncbi:hypothetical protein FJO69_00800 [[Mycoplasma] falconis]|uniref:Lipoprotein-associated type-17 domain-containing protein n=1 Tax=[Mycoplasma] falconis TaxID=92403 RepID=A0A501XB18_9BACT|nr:lipoprotein 17-related variable surface protein [[Mycoplasma] falconis]TPE57722.1 hypothetical protein FJO69_00800 [[Mycoplasma] falconis]